MTGPSAAHSAALRAWLAERARQLGFSAVGVAAAHTGDDAEHLQAWLDRGWHGEMRYMSRHGRKRTEPSLLIPGTVRVISARMDYWPGEARAAEAVLASPVTGYVSRYALGRDYHKVLRRALARLASDLRQRAHAMNYRVFVDSGPVLEKALARNAGLGWIGKHTNLIARDAGSYFFLGEIYTDLPLPVDAPASAHCGSCTACLPACPTGAIVAPHQLDARRCISYLTIELHGSVPREFRRAIGNRIYGCDDCQLVCPWNKYARAASHPDFRIRHALDAPELSALFAWSEAEFRARMAGSAIHRLGHERWLRNVAIALGNALRARPQDGALRAALVGRLHDRSELVREHVHWALEGAP